MSLQRVESPHQTGTRNREAAALYDDVEYLIEIAGRLFSAIEQQIRFIEVSVTVSPDDHPRSAILLKEQLIRIAANLNLSLEEFAVRLGERSGQPIVWAHSQEKDGFAISAPRVTC
ncbi:MAG: hypothetical protein WA359_08490 [Acidimicrobiales bacterium]